jgi:hypothetical protein
LSGIAVACDGRTADIRKPVSFLNLALKLVSPSIYDVEIVIGEPSPLSPWLGP